MVLHAHFNLHTQKSRTELQINDSFVIVKINQTNTQFQKFYLRQSRHENLLSLNNVKWWHLTFPLWICFDYIKRNSEKIILNTIFVCYSVNTRSCTIQYDNVLKKTDSDTWFTHQTSLMCIDNNQLRNVKWYPLLLWSKVQCVQIKTKLLFNFHRANCSFYKISFFFFLN